MATQQKSHRFEVSPTIGDVSAVSIFPSKPEMLLVLGHGAGAGMMHPFMDGLAHAYADANVATLRYQFPFTETGRKRPDQPAVLLATTAAALAFSKTLAKKIPILLGGKSMGARISAELCAREAPEGVAGLVFIGFPLHGPGKPAITRADHLTELRLPMLFLQGDKDKLADIKLMKQVCDKLSDRAQLVILKDADHSFSLPKRQATTPAEMAEILAAHTLQWWHKARPAKQAS